MIKIIVGVMLYLLFMADAIVALFVGHKNKKRTNNANQKKAFITVINEKLKSEGSLDATEESTLFQNYGLHLKFPLVHTNGYAGRGNPLLSRRRYAIGIDSRIERLIR